jgi:hypothetical protein
VKASDVEKDYGKGILHRYNGSLQRALAAAYPEHTWNNWKFMKVAKGFWEKEANVKTFFKSIEDQLGIQDPKQWNLVSYLSGCTGDSMSIAL